MAEPQQAQESFLDTCPACGCHDLYVRKDFPQRLGLGIVALAGLTFLFLAARPRTLRFGLLVLLAATIADAILNCIVRKVTVCYRCGAVLRGIPINPAHRSFELSTAEKYRR